MTADLTVVEDDEVDDGGVAGGTSLTARSSENLTVVEDDEVGNDGVAGGQRDEPSLHSTACSGRAYQPDYQRT